MQCKNCLKMEIDKKIIKKLIETLEDLKKSLNPDQINDVKNTIEKIDLHTKLNVIENFMNIIPKEYENIKCVSTSLNSLHEIVIKLHDELGKINNIIEEHKLKYFSYWRTPVYQKELDNIVKYKSILDDRFETLLKLINTINFLK